MWYWSRDTLASTSEPPIPNFNSGHSHPFPISNFNRRRINERTDEGNDDGMNGEENNGMNATRRMNKINDRTKGESESARSKSFEGRPEAKPFQSGITQNGEVEGEKIRGRTNPTCIAPRPTRIQRAAYGHLRLECMRRTTKRMNTTERNPTERTQSSIDGMTIQESKAKPTERSNRQVTKSEASGSRSQTTHSSALEYRRGSTRLGLLMVITEARGYGIGPRGRLQALVVVWKGSARLGPDRMTYASSGWNARDAKSSPQDPVPEHRVNRQASKPASDRSPDVGRVWGWWPARTMKSLTSEQHDSPPASAPTSPASRWTGPTRATRLQSEGGGGLNRGVGVLRLSRSMGGWGGGFMGRFVGFVVGVLGGLARHWGASGR
ncbi:hypothetical protein FA13DRAFT_1852516 [Coprinellus micaceus]|uniref:Uncharacterized protein n=1 Tax=Coprinellus micaceus TaxID=71717 RepID=A0A4Y7TAN1_COPMI|nr:hypothetical protein FA13DRAFT_1852516 [Coprinellus micaceus]